MARNPDDEKVTEPDLLIKSLDILSFVPLGELVQLMTEYISTKFRIM